MVVFITAITGIQMTGIFFFYLVYSCNFMHETIKNTQKETRNEIDNHFQNNQEMIMLIKYLDNMGLQYLDSRFRLFSLGFVK